VINASSLAFNFLAALQAFYLHCCLVAVQNCDFVIFAALCSDSYHKSVSV